MVGADAADLHAIENVLNERLCKSSHSTIETVRSKWWSKFLLLKEYDFTTILNDQNSRHEKDIKQLNEKNDKLNEKIDQMMQAIYSINSKITSQDKNPIEEVANSDNKAADTDTKVADSEDENKQDSDSTSDSDTDIDTDKDNDNNSGDGIDLLNVTANFNTPAYKKAPKSRRESTKYINHLKRLNQNNVQPTTSNTFVVS